ncbi:polyprenyl synthetase family protein [Acuticoccus sp. MNP-M23]|uniref:polyprenyl synthetase family protein n=1 Tax=Acuticoccus sp. MNP-M23 TaxID=3072793 RepID=UPI0028164E73|nr:polyprenyl synthetase family protein [Acuticoccus sp. MNP-M23]WMS42895.1 polyprenyl synthetase family protein [Acuticoccus sp. MNP-M23]
MNSVTSFADHLAAAAAATDDVLLKTLATVESDEHCPPRLVAATRHALLGGGKRFRPFLVIECARACGASDLSAATAVGAAFECLHAYSLVHDDLPAMDDDDLRRGRPTVHKAFDEATAILVGDGLQALAFQIITTPPVPTAAAGPLARLLAEASGFSGMVGGQYRDLNAIGLDAAGVRLMQSMKTGALIRAACEAGAITAGAAPDVCAGYSAFGARLGEAFQLADDLLDVEGTAEETGKRVGKDEGGGKATIPQLVGVETARARLAETVEDAAGQLEALGADGGVLAEACRFVAERRS